jgi:DNA-directed RNA polymerase specialized sigma24 family protein
MNDDRGMSSLLRFDAGVPSTDIERLLGDLAEPLLLKDVDRELIGLVVWEGFTIADAAAIVGLRPDAARARYGRAWAKLCRQLGASEASPRVVVR